MIKVEGKIPRSIVIACSGGCDSMAILDFLKRSHNVQVAYYNHLTPHGAKAYDFLYDYCDQHNLEFITDELKGHPRPNNKSQEEHWRDERYKFLHNIRTTVVMGHHLDDCVETWMFTSMHGDSKTIPYARGNVIRPFRHNRKRDLELWCNLHNVPFIEDESNADTRYMRNYIRHEMLDHVLKVNPGIHKMVRKRLTMNPNHAIVEDNYEIAH